MWVYYTSNMYISINIYTIHSLGPFVNEKRWKTFYFFSSIFLNPTIEQIFGIFRNSFIGNILQARPVCILSKNKMKNKNNNHHKTWGNWNCYFGVGLLEIQNGFGTISHVFCSTYKMCVLCVGTNFWWMVDSTLVYILYLIFFV